MKSTEPKVDSCSIQANFTDYTLKNKIKPSFSSNELADTCFKGICRYLVIHWYGHYLYLHDGWLIFKPESKVKHFELVEYS